MGVSKVVYNNETLVDLTNTTVTPEALTKGATALNKKGELITGNAKIANCFFKVGDDDTPLSTTTFATRDTNLYITTDSGKREVGSLSFTAISQPKITQEGNTLFISESIGNVTNSTLNIQV